MGYFQSFSTLLMVFPEAPWSPSEHTEASALILTTEQKKSAVSSYSSNWQVLCVYLSLMSRTIASLHGANSNIFISCSIHIMMSSSKSCQDSSFWLLIGSTNTMHLIHQEFKIFTQLLLTIIPAAADQGSRTRPLLLHISCLSEINISIRLLQNIPLSSVYHALLRIRPQVIITKTLICLLSLHKQTKFLASSWLFWFCMILWEDSVL